MHFQVTCVLVDADAENRKELTAFLANFGVQVVAQLPAVDQLATILQRPDAPQLVIANLDPNPHDNLRKMAALPRQHTNVNFMLMSHAVDTNMLMEVMHIGVKEFVPLPIAEEKFAAAIERVNHSYGLGKKAKVIQVIPTIGGCGSTTVACNVAASLASQGAKTVLIDMDLVRGGVASYFDLRPRYTIADVMDSAEKLDNQLLDNALAIHPRCKLAVLARPELPEDTQRITQTGITRLLNVLGRMFDYVVIDSMMSIDPVYSTIIHQVDTSVIVMQLNIPSAKNAERFVGAMRRMGIEPYKLKLVVNRYVKKGSDIEPQEVEKALGLKISWMIPNDFKTAIGSINYGDPLVLRAPKTEIAGNLRGLAQLLEDNETVEGLKAA